jgi:hypothetical protein
MAENQAGVMALPENQDMQKLSIYDSYDATNEALTAARPDAAGDIAAQMQSLRGIADELSNEELDAVIEAVQYLYENKEDYAKNIAELISGGAIEEGTFPTEYDPEFLATFNSILLEERKSRGADQPPFPEKFALGGIADAARIVANQGRYGDTMLAHITPEEARMLRRQGGSGTINPTTGLPEYFNPLKAVTNLVKKVGSGISKVFKSVVSGVKQVLASPVGRIAATIALTYALGPSGLAISSSTWAASAAASATVTLASGGSAKDALKSAAFAAIAAPDGIVGSYVGPTTQAWAGTNEFAKAAMQFGTSAAATTTAALVTGENLQDAVKQGLTSAAIDTGVNLAQKGVSSFKSTSDEITDLANANKGAEAAAAKAMQSGATKGTYPVSDLNGGTNFVTNEFSPRGELLSSVTRDNAGNVINSTASPTAVTRPSSAFTPRDFDYGDIVPSPSGASQTALVDFDERIPGAGTTSSAKVAAAPAPAAAPAAPAVAPIPGQTPGIGASIKKIGGGIADFAQGNFTQGFGDIVKGGEDLFFPSGPTLDEVAKFEAANPNSPKAVEKFAAGPGTFRTYAPAVAGGLGIAALSGAFDQPELPQSEQAKLLSGTPGEDKIAANPDQYVVQNIPGVSYSPEGQIVSSGRAPSSVSMQDVRVGPANYTASMQDVTRPTGGSLMAPMQPQAPLMDPYQYYYQQYLASNQAQQPRYYAMGGITSLPAMTGRSGRPNETTMMSNMAPSSGISSLREGGNSNYPRRTGQIAGPGTEKSDSIPAMLSDGEFVMTAAAVRGMGKGSRREGAKRMYALMHQLEKNAARG